MPFIARLDSLFDNLDGCRFLALYGPGNNDCFFPPSGGELDFLSALSVSLKEHGFRRIIFIAPNQPIEFLDEESRSLSNFSTRSMAAQGKRENEMEFLDGGVFGKRMLLRYPEVNNPGAAHWNDNPIGDNFALGWFDAMFREITPRTALVITQTEASLRFFEDHRTLNGILGRWLSLPTRVQNICLFLFSASDARSLMDSMARLTVPEVRNYFQDETNARCVRWISTPDEKELENLVRILSREGVSTFAEDEIGLLCRWMKDEALCARIWSDRLRTAGKVDMAVAQQKGWFSTHITEDPETCLANMVGLSEIKQRIAELKALARWKTRMGISSNPSAMHMVFSGNPGTGKTTVARLMGQIYHQAGLLPRGHLVQVYTSDLVAGYVGGTPAKTSSVIDRALGGVLFIDEAYTLAEPERGSFGQEAIDTLLARMDQERDKLVVIVAGYPARMERFLSSNPGLNRRFPVANRFVFPDYTPEELFVVLVGQLNQRKIPLPEPVVVELRKIISAIYHQRDETFGNAGEMRNLAEAIERLRAMRLETSGDQSTDCILEDIPEKYRLFVYPSSPNLAEALAELDALIGLQPVKNYLKGHALRINLETRREKLRGKGSAGSLLQHLVFIGNPGTGKTTVARLLGRVYRTLGLLRKGHVVETSRAELVAGYVGQTAGKTMDKIKEALDGILFIDEAYSLARGGENDFGLEAIDTLVKAMEDYRSRFVVIAAGYPANMRQFLEANPGLKSRFAAVLEFHDFTSIELGMIFERMVAAEGFQCDQNVRISVLDELEKERFLNPASFGNARAVRNLFEHMKTTMALRLETELAENRSLGDEIDLFTAADVPGKMSPERDGDFMSGNHYQSIPLTL